MMDKTKDPGRSMVSQKDPDYVQEQNKSDSSKEDGSDTNDEIIVHAPDTIMDWAHYAQDGKWSEEVVVEDVAGREVELLWQLHKFLGDIRSPTAVLEASSAIKLWRWRCFQPRNPSTTSTTIAKTRLSTSMFPLELIYQRIQNMHLKMLCGESRLLRVPHLFLFRQREH